MMTITELTLDVFPSILEHLSIFDVSSLCLTNRSLNHYATVKLYDGTLFPHTSASFDSSSASVQNYAQLLRTLGDIERLGRHVRIFAVPRMNLPHERFDELWIRALRNCPNVIEFLWRSLLPAPLSILQELSSKERLKRLELGACSTAAPEYTDALMAIRPVLRDLAIISPHEMWESLLHLWVEPMGETLVSLHLEDVPWLNDITLSSLHLPHLSNLTLVNCPQITATGLAPVLRCAASSLATLSLGLDSVKIAEILYHPDEHRSRLPRASARQHLVLPGLRQVSVTWEHSLAFWIHLQTLLSLSPLLETVQITKPHPPANSVNNATARPPPPPSIAARSRMVLNYLFSAAWSFVVSVVATLTLVASLHSSSTSSSRERRSLSVASNDTNLVDDSFIRRFVNLHGRTVREFWVIGMGCSDESIQRLRDGCIRLERLKADEVDQFPMEERRRAERKALRKEFESSRNGVVPVGSN